jgi:hypothetical protein
MSEQLRKYINHGMVIQNNEISHESKNALKVLTKEKRGVLGVISFDWSPFQLFSQKFSKESVQAPSCERQKTTQRTLFLLFANNN